MDVFLPMENMNFSAIGDIASRLDAFRATMDGEAFRALERNRETRKKEQTFRARGGASTPAAQSPRARSG